MSKPDFKVMSHKDLHGYVLTHRDDQEAFYAFVDKLHCRQASHRGYLDRNAAIAICERSGELSKIY